MKHRNNGHLPGCAAASSCTFQFFRLQMRRVQPQMNLLGVFFRRVRERHDFLRKNLRLVLAGADFADDEDGLVRFEQRTEFVVVVHHEQLHRAFQILQRHHRIRLAGFFGEAVRDRRDHAADARQAAVRQFGELGGVRERIFFQQRHQRRQRMAGDVKSEQFLFVREQFVLRPFGQIANRFRHRRRFFFQRAEERALAFLFVGQNARRARQRALDLREQRRARLAEAIARAGFDQCFQGFPSACVRPRARRVRKAT